MATPNKLTDPFKVAAALKANKGHIGKAADDLAVSRTALSRYLHPKPPRQPLVKTICDWIVEQPTTIDTEAVKE